MEPMKAVPAASVELSESTGELTEVEFDLILGSAQSLQDEMDKHEQFGEPLLIDEVMNFRHVF